MIINAARVSMSKNQIDTFGTQIKMVDEKSLVALNGNPVDDFVKHYLFYARLPCQLRRVRVR